jgi:hypothetical protein
MQVHIARFFLNIEFYPATSKFISIFCVFFKVFLNKEEINKETLEIFDFT